MTNTTFSSKTEEHFISVNGISTRYLAAGKGDPILLIHGVGAFAEFWHPVMDHLSPYYRVIALDLVGHGRSEKPLDRVYTYQTFAPFVLSFLDALGLSSVTFCGHSLGGGIALQAAIQAPERVENVILISSGGLGTEFSLLLRLTTLPFLGEVLIRPSFSKSKASLKRGVYDSSIVQNKWAQVSYEMSRLPGAGEAFLKTMRDSADLFGAYPEVTDPIVKNLERITAPTLVIWGENDKVIPSRLSAVAMAGIVRSELMLIEKCGHLPTLEHPGKVLNGIAEFLNKHPNLQGTV